MTALPGLRHRTMAPSTILREADVAAMERANAALLRGAHGFREESLDIVAHGMITGWDPEEIRLTANVGPNVALYDLGRWQGVALAGVELWGWQHNAGQPLELYVEHVRATAAQVEQVDTVGANVENLELRTYDRKAITLINARAARPFGWRIPTGLGVARLRVVGKPDDELLGLSLFFENPP